MERDPVALAGLVERCAVCRVECGNLLEQAFGACRGQHLDESGWLVRRVPHGVGHVAGFEGPLASARLADLVAD